MNRTQRVEQAARGWRKTLVDPSGRNRLLYYRDLKVGTLDLSSAASGPVRKLLTGKPGARVRLSKLFPESKSDHPESEATLEDALRRARAVSRKATENFEERGVHTLFVAQGFATWTPNTSKSTPAAPVLMCGAGLKRTGASESDFDLSLDGEWTVNEALLQHLATQFNVEVSGEALLGTKLSDARLDNEEVEEIFADFGRRVGRVPGFKMQTGRLVMGNFMYKKLPMVNDIQNNLEALENHDLIAALAGDPQAREALRRQQTVRVDPSLPDMVPPTDEYLVLDADSTQNQAINAALNGQSFVLEGPPGTGKSQTISNLVATMMARGKKVLFVAEKRAAIEAVLKRLAQVGLDEYVMDFHGGSVSRRQMARQFERTLAAIADTPPVEEQDYHRSLQRTRSGLVEYVDALHQPREPWGMSFFDIQARRLEMGSIGEMARGGIHLARGVPTKVLREISGEEMRSLQRDLMHWTELRGPLLAGPSPWADAVAKTWTEVEQAQDAAASLWDATADVKMWVRETLEELDLPDPGMFPRWLQLMALLEDISTFASAGGRAPEEPEPKGRTPAIRESRRDSESVESIREAAIRDHDAATMDMERVDRTEIRRLEAEERDMSLLVEALAPARKGGLRLSMARLFGSRFREARTKAVALGASSENVTDERALQLASEAQARVAQELSEYREAARLRKRSAQLQRGWLALGGRGNPRIPSDLESGKEIFQHWVACLEDIRATFPSHDLSELTIEQIDIWAQGLYDDLHLSGRLPELSQLEERITKAGIGRMLANSKSAGEEHPRQSARALEEAWLGAVCRALLSGDRRLSAFEGTRHHRMVREFRRSDTDHIRNAPARVRRRVAEHVVQAANSHPDQDGLIRREAAKKTRHIPLRRLFENAPDVLTALRPCWAMSPLDVAQNLPDRPLFDLVVFDEASQVLPCDAISALLRSKRAVVAGDSRQLPPTVFFDGVDSGPSEVEGHYDSQSLTDYESILDVMGSILSRRPITWHYRSRDERLITFSNKRIYHGSLTTFPGAAVDRCLSFELVEHRTGQPTDTRSNPAEVTRVVDLMIRHARTRPEESLGVIAMGRYHADRIEETLRRRLRREQSAELERFFWEGAEERAFVKNLERVQGDERDAIILSIGYGKNAAGRLLYRFGPLNQQGGERRLNVAVTRARSRMTLVSSFSHADMDRNRSSAEGVRQLRAYLKYVESGGTETGDAGEMTPLNAFEVDVLDKLTRKGLEVVPQYGCSGYRIDFAVRHPTRAGQFVLAVEADGASYHSSHTARDRDRLRQEHLERLGWRFCRIWSTNWFNDHRREVDRVLGEYQRAIKESGSSGRTTVEPVREPEPSAPAAAKATLRQVRPPITPGLPIVEYHPQELAQLARWVMSDGLLRTDQQIFEEMFREMGYRRRGPRIKEALYKAIQDAKKHSDRIGGGPVRRRGWSQ